jgi:hypothetical protein
MPFYKCLDPKCRFVLKAMKPPKMCPKCGRESAGAIDMEKIKKSGVKPGAILGPGGQVVLQRMDLKRAAELIEKWDCPCAVLEGIPKTCSCLKQAARAMMIGAAQLVDAAKMGKEGEGRAYALVARLKAILENPAEPHNIRNAHALHVIEDPSHEAVPDASPQETRST